MGIFGNGNLRAEIEEIVRELEEQRRTTDAQCQERIKQLSNKVEQLAYRLDDFENQLSQLKNMISVGKAVPAAQPINEPKVAGPTTLVVSKNIVKLIYTGFNSGVFMLPMRLGVGDALLNNAKANFILECEKGQTEGAFYPNPVNLKVLSFNPQSNLSPVCDIVEGVSCTIVKPGVVTLDPSTNGWKVTTKCQIAL